MLAIDLREPRTQRIGPYEVLLDIGSGGMGTISLARATGDQVGVGGFARLVALKRPLGALASDPEVLQRFLDEARLLAQVHHANVVGIHQIGSDAEGNFLVLDYIEGGTLDELLTRGILHRKKLPPPVVLRIMSDILAGLHAVHEAADVEGRPLHMLHRDVSAQNVLVGKDGVSRVADFGIAKAIISSTVTDKAYLQGRIPYMAPEYLMRESVDRRLDVYAAGMTMWTALAGRLPWGDAAEAQIVKHIVYDGVPPLSSAGVTIAPAIEEITAHACARDLDKRYATAREMQVAVESLGRTTGWIASHAEVAIVVEELLGLEIRARRTAIARRLSSPDVHAAPPLETVLASPADRPVTSPVGAPPPAAPTPRSGQAVLVPPASEVRPASSVQSELTPSFTPSARSLLTPVQGTDARVQRSRSASFAVIALAVAAAAIVVLVWRWGVPPSSLAGPAPSETAAASTAQPGPIAAVSSPPSSAVSAASSAVSAASSVTSVPVSSLTAPQRSPTATGARPQRSGTTQSTATPATLPTGISTNNPYR